MIQSTPKPPALMPLLQGLNQRFRDLLAMVRIQHVIFALPFALVAFLVALSDPPLNGHAPLFLFLMVLFAVLLARNAAMTFNRIVDCRFDRLNPRTQDRHLVTGQISLFTAWIFLLFNAVAFILVAWALNDLAFYLSIPTLGVLWIYSLTKRFTFLSHFFLGFALSLAPLGAWVAVRGHLSLEPFFLALAVFFWVSGFDMIYATQDEDMDRKMGLHSAVVRWGRKRALWVARFLHLLMLPPLFLFGWLSPGLNFFFTAAILIIAGLLFLEHHLVKPHEDSKDELHRLNDAFFRVNGVISLLLLLATVFDLFREGSLF